MVTLHRAGDKNLVMVKGALEQVLALCGYVAAEEVREIKSEDRRVLENTARAYGEQALRVIALAYQEVEREITVLSVESLTGKLILAGIAGMMDPPREEVADAMKRCYEAGITPIMITGDHLSTAMGVARKVGMRNPATIKDIERVSDEELQERIKDTNVFARVLPEQKLRIVNALKANEHIVAMTGDGVNDVPALANSNVSIAMGIKGTDAAKDVSHLVLADDNFASIVAGVEEGRGIKDNIKKAIYFLLFRVYYLFCRRANICYTFRPPYYSNSRVMAEGVSDSSLLLWNRADCCWRLAWAYSLRTQNNQGFRCSLWHWIWTHCGRVRIAIDLWRLLVRPIISLLRAYLTLFVDTALIGDA